MRLLPIDIGRFRLVDPLDDKDVRKSVGRNMRGKYQQALANRALGGTLSGCVEPDPTSGLIQTAIHDGDEVVGSFTLYGIVELESDSALGDAVNNINDIRAVAAKPGPILPDDPNDLCSSCGELGGNCRPSLTRWCDDVALLLAFFLSTNIECDDGGFLDVREFRFPQVSAGDPEHSEWFGDTLKFDDGETWRRELFADRMSAAGIALEVDDRTVPVKATLL